MGVLSRWLYAILMIVSLSGCAAAAKDPERVSNVSVVFVGRETFTDARRADLEMPAADLLSALQSFLITTVAPYVPENMQLNIRITNIDLAGDFESFRGPQADHVRIVRGLYPPRISLEFEVIEDAATVVKAGKRELTDIDYQRRSAYPQGDYLRYEKDILRDWLRAEFSDLRNRTAGWNGEPSS